MARLLSALAVAAALALSPVAFAAAAESIAWTADLRAAQQQANREGKLVLLHFYSDNCPPCRKLEKNVFPQAAVAAAIDRNYVPVKIHVEHMPDLARRYNIEAWPTDLIVTSAGLEVFRTISPQSVAQYQTMLDQVAFQVGLGAGRPNNAHAPEDGPAEGADVALTGGTQWEPAQDSGAAASSGEMSNPYVHSGAPRPGTAGQRSMQRPSTTPPAPAQPATQAAVNQAPGQRPQDSVYAPQPSAYDGQSSIYAPGTQPPPVRTAPQQPAPQPQPPVEQKWQPSRNGTSPAGGDSIYGGGSIYDSGPQQQLPTDSAGHHTVPPQRSMPPTLPPGQSSRQAQQPALQGQPNRQASARSEQRFVDASQAPRVALEGFCPVTILESRKWQKGDVRFGAVHRNRTYLFASAHAQKQFLTDPDRYAPILFGCDPVIFAETNQLIDGNHNIGLLTSGGKMFFFTSEEALQRFKRAPQAYSQRASQAMSSGIVPPK